MKPLQELCHFIYKKHYFPFITLYIIWYDEIPSIIPMGSKFEQNFETSRFYLLLFYSKMPEQNKF